MAEINITTESLITDSGKNRQIIHCQRCDAIILRSLTADFSNDREFLLAQMYAVKTNENESIPSDKLTKWWAVKDMFDFENVGFTHAVDGFKYLTCAECEIGPIGFVDPDNKVSFVSLDRIIHK